MQNYLSDWITKFFNNFFNQRTETLLILLDKEEKFQFESTYKNIISREDFEKTIYNNVRINVKDDISSKLFSEYLISHYLFRINKYRENYLKSFQNFIECWSNFLEIFRIYEEPEFLYQVIKFYMRNLYFSARLGDEELERNKQKPNCIDEGGRNLISFFSSYQMSEQKPLVFYCIICLIRIHFKLKTYRNSKTLVGWVEKSGLDFDYLPKSEVVTYLYYSGRLTLYELKLVDARDILLNALNLCKDDHIPNKKLILEYLIPLNLFFGITPNEKLLSKYNLENYLELISSYKTGNVVKFEEAIQSLEDRLINLGTFLIIEKLKSYVFRNLVRLAYKYFFEDPSSLNKPVMKIQVVYNLLTNVFGMKGISMDELELYIIGTIHKGLISGYVHNNNKVIVFSKKNPFPQLEEVFKNNYNKII
jgi:nuclear mRNA export protein PCID2/THP1